MWRKKPPKVSCLMVTADRDPFAQCAIDSYVAQTYPNKELIIVDSGDRPLDLTRRTTPVPSLTYHRVVPRRTLGELRNIALSLADGGYFLQWDDDDYSSPARIEVQLEHAYSNAASILRRVTLLWPDRLYAGISKARMWEGTLMARKDLDLRFPPLARAEDTPVVEAMIKARVPFGIIDRPELYYYIYHGRNTSSAHHFARLCAYPTVIPLSFPRVFGTLPTALSESLLTASDRASESTLRRTSS